MVTREAFAERLRRLGMHFEGERLMRAEHLVRMRGKSHEDLTDLSLMTICVEAYRDPDVDLPAWV